MQLAIKRGFYHPPPKVQLAIKGGRALYHPQCCCTRGWGAKVAAVSVIYSGVVHLIAQALSEPGLKNLLHHIDALEGGIGDARGVIHSVVHLIALVLPAQCSAGLTWDWVGSVRGGALGSSYCHIYGRCIFTFTGLQFKLHPGLNTYLFKQSVKQFPTYHIYNQVLHQIGKR